MNKGRWSAVCAWVVLPALMAQAQTPDAEALERAQRDAANPLRLIIEAGKIKAKPRAEADARTEPKTEPKVESKATADKPAARPVAARHPAVEPTLRDLSPEATRAAALASVRALTAAAAAEAAEEPPAPSQQASLAADVPPPIAPAVTHHAAPPIAASVPPSSTANIERPPEPAATLPEPEATFPELARVALAVASPALPPPPVALELLNSVQPELPERLLRRMRRDAEVLLVFKVNTDGTVAGLSVQSSSDSALEPVALDAVRQWRYKPIPEARTHKVQFVFKRE